VTNAWIRSLPGHLPAAAYFEIRNAGDSDVTITGAQSAACGKVMLHQSMNMSGMEKMEDVKEVAVPAHDSLSFAPGGYHLMCMDPKPAIKRGAKIPLALQFKDGTSLAATFTVKDARGK
jgi:copper(I)-binding protein